MLQYRRRFWLGTLLALPAFLLTAMSIIAHLFPQAGLKLGSYHLAMGTLPGEDWEGGTPSFLDVCWGNATTNGFRIEIADGGIRVEHGWGWKPTNRPFPPFNESMAAEEGSFDRTWNEFNLVWYNRVHWPESNLDDDVWRSNFVVAFKLLLPFSFAILTPYLLTLSIQAIRRRRRSRLGAFPVTLSRGLTKRMKQGRS
jgi:hypothetical protein